jgi:hypothetical protein
MAHTYAYNLLNMQSLDLPSRCLEICNNTYASLHFCILWITAFHSKWL